MKTRSAKPLTVALTRSERIHLKRWLRALREAHDGRDLVSWSGTRLGGLWHALRPVYESVNGTGERSGRDQGVKP